jgi:hypothetical protein
MDFKLRGGFFGVKKLVTGGKKRRKRKKLI